MRRASRFILGLVLIATVPGVAGCGGDAADVASPQSVRGLIRDVEARSLLELESLTVEGQRGRVWRFEARGEKLPELTPSHLREHMVLGQPVTVTFHQEDGVLVLDAITD